MKKTVINTSSLGMLLFVMLVFSLCPVAVWAQDIIETSSESNQESVSIKNTQNSIDAPELNTNSVTGNIYFKSSTTSTDIVKNGDVTGETLDGTATYDAEKNTLTLNGLYRDGSTLNIQNMGDNFTIKLVGDNDIYGMKTLISVDGNLTIIGDGQLRTNGEARMATRVKVTGNLTINGGYWDNYGPGTGINVEGNMVMNGGTLNNGSGSNGICAKNMTINSGILNSYGGGHALRIEETIEINGGEVTAFCIGSSITKPDGTLDSAIYANTISINDRMMIKAGATETASTQVDAYNNEYYAKIYESEVFEQSITITTAAAKRSYNIGDVLDLTGLVVTGSYSDGTTKIETITAGNVTGFDSSRAAASQVLTITVNGKTTTYTIQIVAADNPEAGLLTAFLGKDAAGNYYEYEVTDFNDSYRAYRINPALASARMYQHVLNNRCQIVALKDQTKGYMDYSAAAKASMMARLRNEAFDLNTYFGSSDAARFVETVENVKIVDKDGNVSE